MEMSGWLIPSLSSKKIFGKDGGAKIIVGDSSSLRDLRNLKCLSLELPIDCLFFLHQVSKIF